MRFSCKDFRKKNWLRKKGAGTWEWEVKFQRGVTLDFSRPGKPTDNAYLEAFNSKLRTECLNAHWFMGLEDTAEKLETWRRDYNEERPRSAIGNNVPEALMKLPDASSPSV